MIVILIKMVITIDPGWSVGAADIEVGAVDQELLTDPDGRPWIPATSLAGSLRAHLRSHGLDELLMGSRPAVEVPLSSRLWLLGTRTAATAEDRPPTTDMVASTAVDPQRRAAQPQSLRFARIVEEAARIELYLMCEGALDTQHLDVLAGWHPSVGARRTTGAGQARLASLAYRDYDLDRDRDLRAWLTTKGHARYTGLTDVPVAPPDDQTMVEVGWCIVDGLHLGTGSYQDKAALTRTRNGQPLLPGSTWKGLFRARTGYIMRTLAGEGTACTSQQGCGTCHLCALFGSTIRRGMIAFTDSIITTSQTRPRTHVAIDRISGGARDQLLFTQEIITAGEMTLRILALEPIADWQRNLLHHVIKDLDDGLIGIGRASQRGQGSLRLTCSAPPLSPVVIP